MRKGPKLNDISRNFTTRDCLGIEGVSASMQAELCPVVNTVTPRAFYWAFLIWIYYDFYKYSGIPDRTVEAFDGYLKRQDYFFVLASLLTKGSDQDSLVGKQQSQIDIDNKPTGPYPYNSSYFKTRYGGMQYYNAGCLLLKLITDEDPVNNKYYSFPVLRTEGEKMAKAFESVIKDTEYYKSYRRNDYVVPRNVLEEYGKVINLGLKGFDECKSMLRHYLFEDDRAIQHVIRSQQLTKCANYLTLIIKDNKVNRLTATVCRSIFYDHMLPSGAELIIPEQNAEISVQWEIVVGRMYFTSGLEMIWKYMLEQLIEPLTAKEWVSYVFDQSDFRWDLQQPLSSVIDECNYNFDDRESMISATASKNTSSYSIENGLKIILSVYNRFHNRKDLDECKSFFEMGINNQSISMIELFDKVEEYLEQPIKNIIFSIMKEWVIDQHYLTAFDKMLQGRDGFYFEIIDGKYVKKHEYILDFQGIRMIQLAQVMRDLDML